MNAMKNWLIAATGAESARLARNAGTSVGYLQQIAGGYRTEGKPNISAELAIRLEMAAARITRPELPALRAVDLCQACSLCPYAKGDK